MEKKSFQSAFFNLRALATIALFGLGALFALLSFAANPTSGTVSPSNLSVTWTGGPYLVPSLGGDTCAAPDECDEFALTVDLPANYAVTNPGSKIRMEISWSDPSGGGADYDMYVKDSTGATVSGSQAASSSNPEVYTRDAGSGLQIYTLRVKPFIPAGLAYTGKVTLIPGSSPTPTPTPTPPPASEIPRYYNYSPGPGVGETAAEPTLGFNLITKRAMFISGLQTLRVTFPETGPCDALWEDVSYVLTSTKSLDPILFHDQGSNRTFVSQLNSVVPPASPVLIGLNSLMAYTDDDGDNWVPAQLNPPDGSYDHQNVGGGPYPASVPLGNPVNKGSAVYYCSQAGVTAFCSRSDDGGLNFGPARAVYTILDGCGGIHGHVKVAPDGTVYLPVRGCGNIQSVVVSNDAGITWQVRQVKGEKDGIPWEATPPPGILDPTVGIATDGTIYFAYIASEGSGGHARVAVSQNKGLTWSNDFDLGASHGLSNAVFANAVAGDPDRAAVLFLGTTTPGAHQDAGFQGTWYVYAAHTYNGGLTWTTSNITPNDPVQRNACIWNGGGSNPCRNLLDFNGITLDDRGRPLYSYADGCIGDCVNGGPNSYSAKATIARQSGGRTLFDGFDPAEPAVPQPACLSGRRDDLASYLTWKAPDNGGATLSSYRILRGTTPLNLVEIGVAEGNKLTYTDRTTSAGVVTYHYQVVAVNSQGDGPVSNTVALNVTPRVEPTGACLLPGVQVLVDPTGDASDQQDQHDITSVSLSEPQALDGKVVFTIKVASLAGPLTPNFRWAIRFGAPMAPPPHPLLGAQEDWFVSMVTSDGPTPTFTYGTTGVPQNVPSRFFVTQGNLDAASNFSVDGTITLVLPKSAIGATTPGQGITSIFGSVRASLASAIPGTGGTNETIPDSTGTGSYQLRPANLCLPNIAPTSRLTATPDMGAIPLAVTFDGSTSTDPDTIDTIATYTFNFGDGTDDVVQSTPTINHTFTEPGLYDVKLVVTDSRGKLSTGAARQLVQVVAPLSSVVSRKLHNGVPYDINLPIDGSGIGIECRNGPAHSLVFTFARNLTSVGGAVLSEGSGTPAGALGPGPNQYTVNLSGVPNATNVTVTLQNVADVSGAVFNASARMAVLAGDVNANRSVNSSDIGQTKANSGQSTTGANFRTDVNTNGSINSSDIGSVKANSGSAVAP